MSSGSQSWLTPDNSNGAAASAEMTNENVFATTDDQQQSTHSTSSLQSSNNASDTVEQKGGDDSGDNSNKKCCFIFSCWWCRYTPVVISLLFVALFAFSSAVQWNDDNQKLNYFLFYLFHAIFAFFGLFRSLPYCKAWSKRLFLSLGVAMWIWSCVLIVLTALDLSKLDNSISNYSTKKEELAYEIAGTGIGLVSATYHLFVIAELCGCCGGNNSNNNISDDGKEVPHTPGEKDTDPVV